MTIEFNNRIYVAPVTIFRGQQFKRRGTITKHTNLVMHENAGSIKLTQLSAWLLKKGYGYHITIRPDGCATQHADLIYKLYHGGKLNGGGIGICLLNPYYPKLVNTDEEKEYFDIIPAEWWTHCSPRSDRRYSKPTEEQIATLKKLIPFLCTILKIPRVYPTENLNRRQRKIKGWRIPGVRPGPGVVAHGDYSKHADGRYALERLIATDADLPCPTCGK